MVGLVVVAEQVEQAMDQEDGDFVLKGSMGCSGLTRSGWDGEDDIAQVGFTGREAVVHGECEDVGGLVDAHEAAFQVGGQGIIGEDDRDGAGSAADPAGDGVEDGFEVDGIDGAIGSRDPPRPFDVQAVWLGGNVRRWCRCLVQGLSSPGVDVATG